MSLETNVTMEETALEASLDSQDETWTDAMEAAEHKGIDGILPNDADAEFPEVESETGSGGITTESVAVEAYDPAFRNACQGIARHAEKAFDSVSGLREALAAGEDAYDLLLKERARLGDKFKRSEVVSVIRDCTFTCSRLALATIKPNAWMKVYSAVRIYFGGERLKDVTKDVHKNLSYVTLDAISRLVECDRNEVFFVNEENITLFRELIASHVKQSDNRLYGKALRDRITKHEEDLKEAKERTKNARMTPEQAEAEERKARRKEEDAKFIKRNRAAETFVESIESTGLLERESIARFLMDKNIIPKSIQSPPPPLDIPSLAKNMSTQDAILFIEELARNNRHQIISVLMSRLGSLVRAMKEKADAEKQAMQNVA